MGAAQNSFDKSFIKAIVTRDFTPILVQSISDTIAQEKLDSDLLTAAFEVRPDTVKQLVDSKAHVNFMNKNGNNALMEATRGYFYSEWNSHCYKTDRWYSGPDRDPQQDEYLEIASCLLKNKADLMHQDKAGLTVLKMLNPGPPPREGAGEIRQNLNKASESVQRLYVPKS